MNKLGHGADYYKNNISMRYLSIFFFPFSLCRNIAASSDIHILSEG